MTSLLLFCTSEVPVETINELMNTPERPFYVLVRDPSQDSFDHWHTPTPVEPFDNGFIGYTVSQLQDFVAFPNTQKPINAIEMAFAILDQESTTKGTVTIWMQLDQSLTTENPRLPEIELEEPVYEWRSWKVTFKDSEELVTDVNMTFEMIPAYCQSDMVDEDGVYDVKRAVNWFINKDLENSD